MRLTMSLAMIATAVPAIAWAQTGVSDERPIRQVVIYGNDRCPDSSESEVVVCARRPEAERNRIPPNLRETPPDPEGRSWSDRARALDAASPDGLNSCSPVGPAGMIGCRQDQVDRWREERAQQGGDDPEA